MESPSVESGEFPTLAMPGLTREEPAPYQAALFHLQQGLLALRALSPGRAPRQRIVHEEIVALQQQVLSLLHIHFAPDGTTDGQSTFGQRLRQHRKEAQLTQEELSRLAGAIAKSSSQGGARCHDADEDYASDAVRCPRAEASAERARCT